MAFLEILQTMSFPQIKMNLKKADPRRRYYYHFMKTYQNAIHFSLKTFPDYFKVKKQVVPSLSRVNM